MPLVEYESLEGIARLTLSAPPANCYSYEMMQELDAAILRARFDADIHAIIIRGAGEKFFCAGADIAMLRGADPVFKYNFCLHANETLLRLEHTPKLVVAALDGHCVGGGLEVALAADLRIARRGSGKCGLPEVKLGVIPGFGGTQRLLRRVGLARALELCLTGDTIDAATAQSWGLVSRVVPAASLMDEARALAAKIAQQAPDVLRMTKRLLREGVANSFDTIMELSASMQALAHHTEDHAEAVSAFLDKRPPVFKGR
jgi:enoyl-CoA hydratase/carnithine racemase